MKLKPHDTHGHQHVLKYYQRWYNLKKHVLRFLVIGRMAHLQILKSNNQVVDHSDSNNNNNGYFKCYFSGEHIALSLKNNDVNIELGKTNKLKALCVLKVNT